jgi:hypothetical protein
VRRQRQGLNWGPATGDGDIGTGTGLSPPRPTCQPSSDQILCLPYVVLCHHLEVIVATAVAEIPAYYTTLSPPPQHQINVRSKDGYRNSV